MTDDDVNTFVYDAENRLVSINSGAEQYKYDHQNRRIEKIVGSVGTHYVWEGSQVIAEHAASTGNVLVDYIFAGGRMTKKVESATTRYFLNDRLSVRLVLSPAAPVTGVVSVMGKQSHLPFGEAMATSGEQDKHRFTSYERETSTGLDYAINRYNDGSVGRFISVDPLVRSARRELPQTWNRYIYTQNDPINLIDPWGLEGFFQGEGGYGLDPCGFWGAIGVIWPYLTETCFTNPLPVSPSPEPIPEPQQAPTCELKLLKKGDPVLGGYPDKGREPADFRPNSMPHGDHLSPDVYPDAKRHYYYYFEVQALIDIIGNSSDWIFKRVLKRRGWFTLKFSNGKESDKFKVDFDDPDEPVLNGNFVWDQSGYRYLDNPSLIVSQFPRRSKEPGTILNADITWEFTVTGRNTRNGVQCNTLKFTLRLQVGNTKAKWDVK